MTARTSTCAVCNGPIREVASGGGRLVWIHASPAYDPFARVHAARPPAPIVEPDDLDELDALADVDLDRRRRR